MLSGGSKTKVFFFCVCFFLSATLTKKRKWQFSNEGCNTKAMNEFLKAFSGDTSLKHLVRFQEGK